MHYFSSPEFAIKLPKEETDALREKLRGNRGIITDLLKNISKDLLLILRTQ
jgi:hypothetical protein